MSSPGSMAAGRPITVRQAPVARRHGVSGILPDGVRIFDLAGHGDVRGRLTEIYRDDWWPYGAARQWNHVASRAGVMRGVHVHTRAAEYYVLLGGRVVVGYRDVRRGSPTRGRTALVELGAAGPGVIAAPPGLAHGVYAVEAFTLLVGTTTVRDDAAELCCHWYRRSVAMEVRASASATAIRRAILTASKRANRGHVGSALSVADLVAGILDAIDLGAGPDRDRFVLSKGHAALAYYAGLVEIGLLGPAALHDFCADGSRLATHPDHRVPGVSFSTGSLGQGVSYAVGSALAARLRGSRRRTIALVSDAELNCG